MDRLEAVVEQPALLAELAALRSKAQAVTGARRQVPFVAQHREMDCAAACLEAVIRYYGRKAGLARCRGAVEYQREGASLFDIKVGAESLGFECMGVRADFETDLDQLPVPFIVGQGHHFVVVQGRRGDTALIVDPALGPRRLPLRELTEKSQGIALLLAPTEGFWSWPEHRTDYSRYTQLVRAHAPQLLRALSYSLLLLGLGAASPWLSRYVFDEVIPLRDASLLVWIGVGYLAVILLSMLGRVARTWVVSRLGFEIDRELTVAVYERLFRLPLSEFQRRSPGDVRTTFDEVSAIRQFITGQLVSNLLEYVNLVVYFVMLVFMAPQLVPLTLVVAPVYAVLPYFMGPLVQRLHALDNHRNAELDTVLIEQVHGFRTIKSLGMESDAERVWRGKLDAALWQSLSARRKMFPINAGVDVFQSLVGLGCLMLAAHWAIAGEMTIGAMIAGTQLVSQILGPVAAIAENWTDLHQLRVSAERVQEALAEETESAGGDDSSAIEGEVSLRNVTYRYARAEKAVLDDVSVTFARGEITALVGRSGSGKTTISQLLNRLLEPVSGQIAIAGVDVRAFALERLRKAVGVALPEYHLFQGKILDNLALGEAEPADRARAERACQQAQIHDFIAGLPAGYDTRIPESGFGLSSGQKQRLALARLLYRDPPILLLDEVTSYLDQASERAILSHLRDSRRDKTTIIITHRPTVLAYADRVLVLDEGKIRQDLRASDPRAQGIFERI